MGRARGGVMNVGSLRQQPIREEPSPTGSHEDGTATASGTASISMPNGIDPTVKASNATGLFSPQTQRQRANGFAGSTNAYSNGSAPPSGTQLYEYMNVQSPGQNVQMVVGLPPDGTFVSDSFLTSENPRPEADANAANVHWALSPSAVRHV